MMELKISRLMDDYVDNEVCIEGDTWVDNEELKGLVLEQAKTKQRMKPVFKGLIAAAAAVFVLAGAVVGSDLWSGAFTTGSGIKFQYEISDNGFSYEAHLDFEGTVTTENGRLYLNSGDETVDITDLVDEKTPYIYSYTNPGTGDDAYLIAAGTPEHYEFVDLFRIDGIGWIGMGAVNGYGGYHIHVDIEDFDESIPWVDEWDMRTSRHVYIDIYDPYYGQYDHDGFYDENGNLMSIDYGEGEDLEYLYSHPENWTVVPFIPDTWYDDCYDAWLLSALGQLDLIELP